jgi:hypothetical protein
VGRTFFANALNRNTTPRSIRPSPSALTLAPMSHLLSCLWSNARDVLARLRASIGRLDVLDRKEARDLRQWIAGIEAYVRRIVLLEALSFLDRGSSDPHLLPPKREARPKTRGSRKPRLRLWPRAKSGGPRVYQFGPPVLVRDIWRDNARAALIARLRAARFRRRLPHIILADRIDALDAILAAPMRAARRLARKLKQLPRLALKLAFTPTRPVRGADEALQREAHSATITPALEFNSS